MGLGLAGTLRRTNPDKRRAVEIALKEFPKLSSREIAKVCAVSPDFVSRVRPEQVSSDDTSKRITGADGKSYPATKPARPAVEATSTEPSKPAPREIVVPFVVPPQRSQGRVGLGNRTHTGHQTFLCFALFA